MGQTQGTIQTLSIDRKGRLSAKLSRSRRDNQKQEAVHVSFLRLPCWLPIGMALCWTNPEDHAMVELH